MNLSWKSEAYLSFMRNDKWVDFVSLGASTCVKLKQFEEAIFWCDKGLAVSFLRWIHAVSLHNYCFFTFNMSLSTYFFSFQYISSWINEGDLDDLDTL